MTVTNYATVAELKVHIGIADGTDDGALEAVLGAVSRGIDNHCRRFFYRSEPGTVRYYTPKQPGLCLIDDCVSLSAVATDTDGDRVYETVWTAAHYDLTPDNAAADGWPYLSIQPSPASPHTFACIRKGLALTGVWGWPAVPDPIREACLIQAARVFKRKDSPFGISGSPEFGQMRIGKLDPDVIWLLEPYHVPVIA